MKKVIFILLNEKYVKTYKNIRHFTVEFILNKKIKTIDF